MNRPLENNEHPTYLLIPREVFFNLKMFVIVSVLSISGLMAVITLPVFPIISIALLGFILAFVGSYLATKVPLVMIFGVLITAVLPYAFVTVELFDEDYFKIGGGIQYVDIFLLAMVGALLLEFFSFKHNPNEFSGWGLKNWLFIFFTVLVWDVVRNLGVYGLSAPGEFRFRYLILVLPIYIAIFFRTPQQRVRLLTVLIIFSTLGTMLCVPFIGMIKGWGVGPDDRFLPAQLSMSLFQGFIALYVVNKYNLIRVNPLLFWLVIIPILLLMVIDSHRSAWLASAIILMVLTIRGEFPVRRMFWMIIPFTIVAIIIVIVVNSTGISILEYIIERGSAYFNPEEDSTSSWRLFLWAAQLQKFIEQPWFGEGFGGYWEVFVPELGQTLDVQPHNLYIQTLVKTGLIGLGLYLIIILKTWFKLKGWLKLNLNNTPECSMVLIAYTYLISSHVYYFVYSHDYYSLMYIGLGASVVLNNSNESRS